MRKRGVKLIVSVLPPLLALILLCGCSRSLGERAIVKIVYLDEAEGKIQAGLAVFTCAPNSDTASVEGEARIYTAQGASIEEALYNAERLQNKKPFYAQNEILLLGPGAAEDVTPYLEHFAAENAARPDLAAFLTPLTLEEFAECEEGIGDVVREGERLMSRSAEGTVLTQSLFELELSGENGMNGYLPVFSFSKEEKDFCGVRQLALIRDGTPYRMLEDAPMQLFLLLAGKSNRLTVYTQIEGETVSFHAQQLVLSRVASVVKGVPALIVRLTGTVEDITADGVPVGQDSQQDAARRIDQYLNELANELNEATFAQENDIFHYGWWMKQYDTASCEALLRAGLLYETAQIKFECMLEPA